MKKIILATILILLSQSSFAGDTVCKRVYQDEPVAEFTLKPNNQVGEFAVDLFMNNKKIDTLVVIKEESSIIGRTYYDLKRANIFVK